MKLKDDFIMQNIDGGNYIVATGESAEKFKGLGCANETASRIIELLKKNTTIDEMVGVLFDEYEASREELREGVETTVEQLRKIGAIEE